MWVGTEDQCLPPSVPSLYEWGQRVVLGAPTRENHSGDPFLSR